MFCTIFSIATWWNQVKRNWHYHILFVIMSLGCKSMHSVHFFSLLSLKVMSFVSWLMQQYVCSCIFLFHVCVLCVTRHYLHTLFLISHFTRFLSSAGNRKMKKQAAVVDESEIEKWKGVRSRGRREHCRWFSPQTRDGNQSPWKQHKSADHIVTLTSTHLQQMHTQTHT